MASGLNKKNGDGGIRTITGSLQNRIKKGFPGYRYSFCSQSCSQKAEYKTASYRQVRFTTINFRKTLIFQEIWSSAKQLKHGYCKLPASYGQVKSSPCGNVFHIAACCVWIKGLTSFFSTAFFIIRDAVPEEDSVRPYRFLTELFVIYSPCT